MFLFSEWMDPISARQDRCFPCVTLFLSSSSFFFVPFPRFPCDRASIRSVFIRPTAYRCPIRAQFWNDCICLIDIFKKCSSCNSFWDALATLVRILWRLSADPRAFLLWIRSIICEGGGRGGGSSRVRAPTGHDRSRQVTMGEGRHRGERRPVSWISLSFVKVN